jgi:outer membrane protein assembly factor BamB
MRETEARFEEDMGGAGPRATPALEGGALYALGARGNHARLDARTGAVDWEVDVAGVAGREPPTWGFAGSPLPVGDLVVVHAGGAGTKGTLAFDARSGELRWSAAAGDHSYSSPQPLRLLGEDVIGVLTNTGLDVLDPATGAVRLAYSWPYRDYRALQPQRLGDDGLLLPTGPGGGTRRLRLSKEGDRWSAEELWTSRFLKPDFNDVVVAEDHAFGFDGSLFTCIDLANGDRVWKEGRYGKGQVLTVVASSHLLVTAEFGEVVLLALDPSAHRELARFQALEGKTWNHPVLVGDRLYVRNGEQAAAWRLPLAHAEGGPGF